MLIYLGPPSPAASSDLPENGPGRPIVLVLVLLRMGFTWLLRVTTKTVVSYTAFSPLPAGHFIQMPGGRYISVALAWESPPPDVIRHPALRSPDFPQLRPFGIGLRPRSWTGARTMQPRSPALLISQKYSHVFIKSQISWKAVRPGRSRRPQIPCRGNCRGPAWGRCRRSSPGI